MKEQRRRRLDISPTIETTIFILAHGRGMYLQELSEDIAKRHQLEIITCNNAHYAWALVGEMMYYDNAPEQRLLAMSESIAKQFRNRHFRQTLMAKTPKHMLPPRHKIFPPNNDDPYNKRKDPTIKSWSEM